MFFVQVMHNQTDVNLVDLLRTALPLHQPLFLYYYNVYLKILQIHGLLIVKTRSIEMVLLCLTQDKHN